MTQILDIQKSIIAANGNTSLAKELFTMLLDDLDQRLEQIEISFKEKNLEALAEHAHKLHGATAYCVVPNLREYAKTLEYSLKEKTQPNLTELVENVLSEMLVIIKEGPALLKQKWN
ncbi:MAG: Hpt domain-containing protein [Woeseiaceae bacterium]